MMFHQKLKIELLHDSVISLFDVYLKLMKSLCEGDTFCLHFYDCSIHNCEIETSKVAIN